MMKNAFIALALVATPALTQDELVSGVEEVTLQEATTLQDDDHTIGDLDAPHELVIYASVTCGHCGQWFNGEWPEVKSELIKTGRLRVAVREVPSPPASASVAGFMIANCAAPEEDWFANIERQFSQQDTIIQAVREGKGESAYLALAALSGIEGQEAFQACLESDDDFASIDRSMRRHAKTGASGVPVFYLDGERVDGAHAASDFLSNLSPKSDD